MSQHALNAAASPPSVFDRIMTDCQGEMINHVTCETSTEGEVFSCIERVAHALGFDYVSYTFQAPLPLSQPRFSWMSNYPDAWQNHYAQAEHVNDDPRIIRARRSGAPFVWTPDLFQDNPGLWDALQRHGICHGWTQSTLDEPGGIGVLSLSRRHPPLTDHELGFKQQHMQWLALLSHKAISRLIRARLASASPHLTDRELEILRWTADGKSAQDIAEILILSKNTVDFHIKNLINKLDVPNKTAAVVRAILLGLFH